MARDVKVKVGWYNSAHLTESAEISASALKVTEYHKAQPGLCVKTQYYNFTTNAAQRSDYEG